MSPSPAPDISNLYSIQADMDIVPVIFIYSPTASAVKFLVTRFLALVPIQ